MSLVDALAELNVTEKSFDIIMRGERSFRFTGCDLDIGYIYYLDNAGPVDYTVSVPQKRMDFNVDLNKDGRIFGIECMSVRCKPDAMVKWLKGDMKEEFKTLYTIWQDLMTTCPRRIT